MAVSEATGSSSVEIPSLHQWTIDRILEWSAVCGRFLKWEKEHMLLKDPTPEERKEHEEALTWLLRLTTLYHAAVSDPQFPEHRVAQEMQGRLCQLRDSWEMFYHPMPAAEADKLLAEVFPGMNAEGEAVFRSYEAYREALESGEDAARLYAIYQSRLDDVLAHNPHLSRDTLHRAVVSSYKAWLRAQQKPSALPPTA